MPGKGYKTTALEVEVLNDLQRLARELSVTEDRRVTMSDTVRLLMQTYYAMYPNLLPRNGTS